MLPIQADTMALRVPWAAPLAALGLTLATSAWIAFLLLHPLARGIKIFGAVVAVPLVIMSIGGWFGVLSVESWVAHGGAWIILGTISEFVAIGFLVYATMSREAVSRHHDATAGGLDLRRDRVRHHASVCRVHSARPSSTRRLRACRATWAWARRSPSA